MLLDRCHTCNFLAQFCHAFSRATKLQVWHGESCAFLTVTQLYFGIDLCSILCNSVDRMLNADWSAVIVDFVLLLFAVRIHLFAEFILIYLIYSTWKWNGRMLVDVNWLLQYRHQNRWKPQRCHSQSHSAATLLCNFVAHSRDKIAGENCRCDIGLRLWPHCPTQLNPTQLESGAVVTQLASWVELNPVGWCDRSKTQLNSTKSRQLDVSCEVQNMFRTYTGNFCPVELSWVGLSGVIMALALPLPLSRHHNARYLDCNYLARYVFLM